MSTAQKPAADSTGSPGATTPKPSHGLNKLLLDGTPEADLLPYCLFGPEGVTDYVARHLHDNREQVTRFVLVVRVSTTPASIRTILCCLIGPACICLHAASLMRYGNWRARSSREPRS
mgnify:CR=1 FL=1